ncbi:MAG: Ig-like domain-containing protein, partial [Planctomycetes bacterium]|nr:Ig-like domain-containing protein [Planctomycetota bacterium]
MSIAVVPEQPILHGPRVTQRLVVMGTFEGGGFKELSQQVQFSSSNPAIATVSPDGMVTPVADGCAEITATVGQVSNRPVEAEGRQVGNLPHISARATVTVKNFADRSLNFTNDLLPVISKAGCNITGCHGSPKGKKSFKLSLFGAEVVPDFEMLSHSSYGMLVNRIEPEKSYFLLKATGTISHGGGKRVEPGSPEYKLLAE